MKKFQAEEIILKLRVAEAQQEKGLHLAGACRSIFVQTTGRSSLPNGSGSGQASNKSRRCLLSSAVPGRTGILDRLMVRCGMNYWKEGSLIRYSRHRS